MKKLLTKIPWLALIPALFAAGHAEAQTDTDTFTVNATVVASCTISGTTFNFGNYDPIVTNASTPLDVNSVVTVTCTPGSAVTVGIDQGLYSDTGSTPDAPLRRMRNATITTEFLDYAFYSDASRGGAFVWGDAGTAQAVSHTTASTASEDITIYGRVPAATTQVASGNTIVAGDYSDTVTATVTF
ncbi:MAG: spore coat protein U domain-containing protein [Myxococcales bacterium]|nr:spore coat protein U domain-containing protein [Myxococcales bacterium]